MASTTYHTIIIRGNPYAEDLFYDRDTEDGVVAAATTIQPGQLIELDGSGNFQEHSTAADAEFETMVAVEDPYPVTPTSVAIDANYVVGDLLRYVVPRQGNVLYMWLANGENVAKGAALEADGNGDLQALTTGKVVGYANEAVNATGGRSRIKTRML
jgi:hypothetical protein